MTTPIALITLALKHAGVLGVGQSALPEDVNDAFTILNFMLDQWQRKRWLIWHLKDVSYPCNGSLSYTVGTGMQFNTTRPDRIESAFFRQIIPSVPNQIDYPLEIIEARETYNQIALKSLVSFPEYVFYDAAYPVGFLYFYPVPTSLYECHISVKETLSEFTSLNQTINLPPEYSGAILYNLACRLRPMYQLPPDPSLVALAKDALQTIRLANTQIPRLTMPSDLVRPGIYNVYSDEIR